MSERSLTCFSTAGGSRGASDCIASLTAQVWSANPSLPRPRCAVRTIPASIRTVALLMISIMKALLRIVCSILPET